MTIGADSLVSQPSTRIWNTQTIRIDSQYCTERKMPVRNHASSARTTSTMAMTVKSGYSATRVLPRAAQHIAHGLVREKPADRDEEEEHQLLERHDTQMDAGREERAVRPVVAQDPDDIPDGEDHDRRKEREEQSERAAIDAGAHDELERQRQDHTERHQGQVLPAVVHQALPRGAMSTALAMTLLPSHRCLMSVSYTHLTLPTN